MKRVSRFLKSLWVEILPIMAAPTNLGEALERFKQSNFSKMLLVKAYLLVSVTAKAEEWRGTSPLSDTQKYYAGCNYPACVLCPYEPCSGYSERVLTRKPLFFEKIYLLLSNCYRFYELKKLLLPQMDRITKNSVYHQKWFFS